MYTQNAVPENQPPTLAPSHDGKTWLFASLAFVLACAAIGTFAYAQNQRQHMEAMAAANQTLNASVTQMQEQLQSVTERLTRRIEESKPAPAPVAAPVQARTVTHRQAPPAPKADPVALNDPRVDSLQEQFTDQQKAIASTREDLDRTRGDLDKTQNDLGKTRDELNGKIDSSRDELNGTIGRTRDELNTSIAHTHDELVALQKRGEKNYFEFAINKSKEFQRVGPLSLEVRKVDFKHKSYDVDMLVDDFTLQKRKVNLFEPVWINLTDAPEPVQLIVNQIDKDKIAGYIAAPKYRKSELGQTALASPARTTVQ